MNKIFVIFTALLLSACSARLTQLQVPNQIEHNGKKYTLAASQDLETIARFVYLSEPDTLEKWQSEIEVLFDRNTPPRSIQDRIALREKAYRRNAEVKKFHFDEQPAEKSLTGYVIYAPSQSNPSWQVNVVKGKDLVQCGFVQYQYAQRIPKTKEFKQLTADKIQKHLQKYIVEKELNYQQTLAWQWCCQL